MKIYTDGSLNPITNKTTCAVFIPSLRIREAYTLSEGTSIFAAEGNGILKAMELILQHNEEINEILIISDSRLIIQTLNSTGTKTTLYWITQSCWN